MKNEVVALVVLYLGVASEFILPLGVELGLANNTSKYNKTVVVTTDVSQSTAPTVELLKGNSVIEKDLYEYDVPKKNQSERAFIYIKKKFMKPNLFQRLKHVENRLKFDPEESIHLVPPNLETRCECLPKDNSYFIDQPFTIVDKKSYLAQIKKNTDVPEAHEHKMIYDDERRMPDRTDVEKHNNIDISRSLVFNENYDPIPNQNLPYDQYTDFDKLRHIRKSIDLSKVSKQESKSKMRETYGYNSAHGRHRDLDLNEQIDNFRDPHNLQDLLAGDFEPEKSDYDDKLLDKYLKEDLEEESKSNETTIHENARSTSTSQQKDERIESGNRVKCKCE